MALQAYTTPADYAEPDYLLEWDDTVYIEPDYFVTGYIGNMVYAAVDLSFTATTTAIVTRIYSATTDLSLSFTTTQSADRTRSAELALSSQVSTTSSTARIRSSATSLSASWTSSAAAVKIARSAVAFNFSSETSFRPLRIFQNSVTLSAFAFDTFAAGRIRSTQSDVSSKFSMTADPIRIRDARLAPVTGIHFGGDRFLKLTPTPQDPYTNGTKTQFSYDYGIYYNTPAAVIGKDLIVSLWARVDPSLSRGTMLSTDMSNAVGLQNYQNAYGFKFGGLSGSDHTNGGIANSSIDVAGFGPNGGGGIAIGTPYYPDNNWHHYLTHILQWDAGTGSTHFSVSRFYVDGQIVADATATHPIGQSGYITDPLYIGVLKRYKFPSTDNVGWNMSELFKGDIKQIWIGYDGPTFNYTFDINDFYNANVTAGSETLTGYVNLGREGRTGAVNQLPVPIAYNPLDYYEIQSYGEVITAHQYSNAYSNIGNVTTLDSSWIPSDASKGIDARFSLIAAGDRTKFVEQFNISAKFTLTSEALRVYFVAAALSAKFSCSAVGIVTRSAVSANSFKASLTSTPYDFTKAAAAIAFKANQTALALRIFQGIDFTLGRFTVTAEGQGRGDGSAAVSAKFSMISNASLKVYVRASVATSAKFTITSQPRASFRSAVVVSANFTLTPNNYRLRSAAVNLQWQAFTIEAGRIIAIDRNNTLSVAQETRIFWADDISSPHILVAMENGVNSVMADTTIIPVKQETGLFLAQQL